MDELMTIGEFSDRCGLSPKVLRTYADVGVLVPAVVDDSSGYRYYEPGQLAQAEIVRLLRRAGVAVSDIGRFVASPSREALDGWERSLTAEVWARRQALSEVRWRLGLGPVGGGADIRPVRDRAELESLFDLLGAQFPERITTGDWRFDDLATRFPADQPLMLAAVVEGRAVGGTLAFRYEPARAGIRMVAVVEAFRGRGIGRWLVENVEAEARRLGVERLSAGTGDEAVGFWYRVGYTAHLLFQWVYDADRTDAEVEAVMDGPLAGLRHWRSAFNGVPQLFVELDEPRLDLRDAARQLVSGCHVGFMVMKDLAVHAPGCPAPGRPREGPVSAGERWSP